MKVHTSVLLCVGIAVAGTFLGAAERPGTFAAVRGNEWPGWLGPQRDAHSPDADLLKQWPPDGPPRVWDVASLGSGWSSVAVSHGSIYTTGNVGDKQMLFCLDGRGREKWRTAQSPICDNREYPGARSTPTVDGDKVYVTGGNGLVTCHHAANGQMIWQHDMAKGGQVGGWKYAESVLVLDDLAVVTPGGKHAIVALDKTTGRTVWQCDAPATAGYSSCTAIRKDGGTAIVNGTQSGLLVVDAKTGQTLWTHNFAANNIANVPTPAYADGHLFWAVGYGKGGLCVRVEHADGRWSFAEAWTTKDMSCDPGNYLIADGCIYGAGKAGLVCIDLNTGRTNWCDGRIRAGSMCWAEGRLVVFAESKGVVRLVQPLPDGCRIVGALQVAGQGKSWALPVVIGGRLYLRYDTNLYCYDVKAR